MMSMTPMTMVDEMATAMGMAVMMAMVKAVATAAMATRLLSLEPS